MQPRPLTESKKMKLFTNKICIALKCNTFETVMFQPYEALQGLQIRYASLSNAKLIWTKMKNRNVNLCIMTQGLQIRYALLPVQHYNPDSNQN